VTTYKDSPATRKKKSEASKRFWAERRKQGVVKNKKEKETEPKRNPESKKGVAILTSMDGGNTEKFLKATRFLRKHGPLSEEAEETLSYIKNTKPELYNKYF